MKRGLLEHNNYF